MIIKHKSNNIILYIGALISILTPLSVPPQANAATTPEGRVIIEDNAPVKDGDVSAANDEKQSTYLILSIITLAIILIAAASFYSYKVKGSKPSKRNRK